MPHMTLHAEAQQKFDPAPSLQTMATTKLAAATSIPEAATCVAIPVATDGDVPKELGLDRTALAATGFQGKVGQTQIVPRAKGPTLVAVGIGPRAAIDTTKLRDAAAAFAKAAEAHERIAMPVPESSMSATDAAQAIVEGAVLARYRYLLREKTPSPKPLRELTVVGSARDELERGVNKAGVTTRAAELARDLAGSPGGLLTARRLADIAQSLGAECGLEVEVFDEKQLFEMGCGGMLGVNAGSVEPPRMIKLTYRPSGTSKGNLALIAKGIMFDAGGLGLKPNNEVHAAMKGDMSGAAAVLAAMTSLKALSCPNTVTAYLMCTDNMPSGTALKLSDVITIRGGTTVEVINPDAEGRLVMADGLVLATEQDPRPDAIIDIATLTGACQRALGVLCAGVMGNSPQLVEQLRAAAERSDEQIWELPLIARYRKELDSEIADLKNVGGENAGAITAGLFLQEFVAGIPWAHLDIAGTARVDSDETWRPKGPTGFGARLLIDLLTSFAPAEKTRPSRSRATNSSS